MSRRGAQSDCIVYDSERTGKGYIGRPSAVLFLAKNSEIAGWRQL
jgi:hypothetical protein